MILANYSELRSNLKSLLDSVENEDETLIVKRNSGKGVVVISLDEYNSQIETMHLLKSKANANRLRESIDQVNNAKVKDLTL